MTDHPARGDRDIVIGRYSGLARTALAGGTITDCDPHEPVVLIRPGLGSVAWDPGEAPPPRPKATGHRKPHGLVPP
jgi:hypothetical protein